MAALTFLAELPYGDFAGAGDIAEEIGAPRNYLGKLLKTLADAGLVESQKGKGGGFRLARDPGSIPLIEAVEPIEHVGRWSECFLGRGRCSNGSPCRVHGRWAKVRDTYLNFLKETTLADLASRDAITSGDRE
ncbi:MAG: Rrf2 family transcriptional regulator [Pirellulales bacterium]|nr:Rrf2 family transcriptional regulator [Pirellulales bacterium]